jgi:hypothetical protein
VKLREGTTIRRNDAVFAGEQFCSAYAKDIQERVQQIEFEQGRAAAAIATQFDRRRAEIGADYEQRITEIAHRYQQT